MEFLQLFPTIISKSTIDSISESELLSFTKHLSNLEYFNLNELGSFSNDQKVLEAPIFDKLTKEILERSRVYLKRLGHIFEDVQISNSWVNILNTTEQIQPHHHSNSYISGVFYVSEGSDIVFRNNHVDDWIFAPDFEDTKSVEDQMAYHLTPHANLLILFPSWLPHNVLPSEKQGRVSVAFNIIPKGEFGRITSKVFL